MREVELAIGSDEVGAAAAIEVAGGRVDGLLARGEGDGLLERAGAVPVVAVGLQRSLGAADSFA